MAQQKVYIVDGRIFRTEADHRVALRDQETIETLRKESAEFDCRQLTQLKNDVHNGKYKFNTLLGQDFEDELAERIKEAEKRERTGERRKDAGSASAGSPKKTEKPAERKTASKKVSKKSPRRPSEAAGTKAKPQVSEEAVREALRQQEKRRRLMMTVCGIVAIACLGYFGIYVFFNQRTGNDYEKLAALKEKEPIAVGNQTITQPVIHYTDEGAREVPEVLDEYKNLLLKNKKLIGWIKIDDTNIDYPVMQTSDNEYYLEHNINQEYDKNGSIFLDKDCDVLKPSTNLILYGHHMQSGKMFGNLGKYSDQKYCENHRYIKFDTIYEKGVYEVMYVFRSRVYSEEEVVFKYYQFIDAMSAVEFDSYMKEMADISLYDTGVSASYGDRLLTLSTCDYQEKNGRFVVVARKVE